MQQLCIGFGQAGVRLTHTYVQQNDLDHSHILFIDNDYEVIDQIIKTNKYPKKSFIKGKMCSASNWVSGGMCTSIAEDISQRINSHLESMDKCGGFKVFNSLTGGSSTSLYSKAFHSHQKISKVGIVVWPNQKYKSFENVVAPLNCILGLPECAQYLDMNIIVENEAFYHLKQAGLTLQQTNQVITSPLCLLSDLNKITTSMVSNQNMNIFTMEDLKMQLHFSGDHKKQGKPISQIQLTSKQQYICQRQFLISQVNQYKALKILLNTNIQYRIQKILEQFQTMHATRCFQHWYYGNGISEGIFSEASQNVRSTLDQIKSYQ